MQEINFEGHFKDLFDNTSDLIHFLDIDAKIELVNSAWLSTLGYELHEIVGKSIFNFIHPDYTQDYKTRRERIISMGNADVFSTAFITNKKETIYAEGQISVNRSPHKSLYTRGVFKNVSGSIIYETKLFESESRLKALFTSAPDGVIIINEDQVILDWNTKAEKIFGYKAEEVVGNLMSETIIPHKYREAHKRGMQHFLETGVGPVLNKTIEITALHKAGHEFFINLSISNVLLKGKWIFIGFLSDITERKRTEEQLIRKEAELLQSKVLEERKDEFISIASHELKTPLSTIKAFTQIAIASCDNNPDKVKPYLEKINHYTDKLSELVNELLDVSKIEAGKLKIDTLPVELSSFLKDSIQAVQHIIPDHKILVREIKEAIVAIDAGRLEQVITNLLGNAAKYSPGKNEIYVNTELNNGSVIVSVTDLGIGIPQKKLDKVFTRFYRVNEHDNQFSGLGIGLYISAEIIKQHGGKIWAESTEGSGSTFYFSLPLQN